MKSSSCPQYDQLIAAVLAGRWPEGSEPELGVHVKSCPTCSDAVLVAEALQQSRREAVQLHASQLPAPGILWWRAQILRRQQAFEHMTRPIALAEKAAALIVVMTVMAFIVWQQQALMAWLSRFWGPLSSITQIPILLILGLISIVTFGGCAVYLLRAE